MRSLSQFARVIHLTGVAGSDLNQFMSSSTYTFTDPLLVGGTSYAQWKFYEDTAAPSFRAIRATFNVSFAYFISITPTTPSNWQSFLTTLQIGRSLDLRTTGDNYRSFVKPTHSHSVTGYPTLKNTGTVTTTVYPTSPFTGSGITRIKAGQDWFPPLRIGVNPFGGGTQVRANVECFLIRLDGIDRITDASIVTDAGVLPGSNANFTSADLAAIDPGLFRRDPTGLGNNWIGVPGSNVTGYTAPTGTPSQYQVKQGTI